MTEPNDLISHVPGGWGGVAAGFGSIAAGLLWLRRVMSSDSADRARDRTSAATAEHEARMLSKLSARVDELEDDNARLMHQHAQDVQTIATLRAELQAGSRQIEEVNQLLARVLRSPYVPPEIRDLLRRHETQHGPLCD